MRPIVLICIAHYLPGWKFGGPTSTIANLIENLGEEFQFYVFTSDRDFGEESPYPDITRDQWIDMGRAKVFYASPQMRNAIGISKVISETNHDILYLNSLFRPDFTIVPLVARRLGFGSIAPCVLAPRGEFAPAALAIKHQKKRVFLQLARLLGLYRDILWQASSPFEAEDIRRVIGSGSTRVAVAANLPRKASVEKLSLSEGMVERKEPRPLQVALVARISRMKNLEFALHVLRDSAVPVDFDVWGTIEDQQYWELCESIVETLPPHVRVSYRGGVARKDIEGVLTRYDLMFMPSLGENFGHAIAESLSVGTPVLISDKTPWRNLAGAGVGWDLPLTEGTGQFVEALAEASRRTQTRGEIWRAHVLAYAQRYLLDPAVLEANRRLFLDAMQISSLNTQSASRAA